MNTTPTLITLDPKLLTTNHNVRTDLVLGKDFLASIKLHGVRTPIEAFPDPLLDGHYQVHTGHRRAAAALAADLPGVLVLVISAREAADRVTEQLVENLHRQELTPQDLAAGYNELSLFGLSAMAIAKSTSSKLARVGDAIRVAKAPTAAKALEQYQLTIDDALVFAEFADDTDALVELNRTATNEPSQIAHAAQVLRNERAERATRERLAAEIVAAGITLLESRPPYDDKTTRPIEVILTSRLGGMAITADVACAEAADDLRAYVKQDYNHGEGHSFSIGYAVTNWADHGWFSTNYGAPSGPLTEKEKDARREARENTKLWIAATAVRLTWLKAFIAAATPPAGWELLATQHIIDVSATGSTPTTWKSIVGVLGIKSSGEAYSYRSEVRTYLDAHPRRSAQVATAIALGSIEGSFEFDRKGWQQTKATEYLVRLAGWGYMPSALEQSIIDAATTKGN